ncbi:MAG: hypothetical protein HDR11_15820 [Lachnospiraceae bacterium]|nr:hypothetical protein [Lachnospiraceae bacterium]
MDINEIRKEYGIEATDLAGIRYELKALIKKVHPDNSAESDNDDYIKGLNQALSYVEQNEKDEMQLVLVPKALTTVISNTSLTERYSTKNDKLQEKLDTNIKKVPVETKNKTRAKRVGLAMVTSMLSFIWFLPKTIEENPVFKLLFANMIIMICFSVVWFIVFMVTVIYWCHVFNGIKKEKDELNHIRIESVQNKLFNEFLIELKSAKKSSFSEETFSKFIRKNIVDRIFGYKGVIEEKYGKELITDLGQEAIQNVADIILLRAEEHEVIHKINKRSLTDYYKVIDA